MLRRPSRAVLVLLFNRRRSDDLTVGDRCGGRRRSAVTLPGYHAGRPPGNNGMR